MTPAPVVLIVTPDRNLREASARVLAREGYEVRTAAHAGHAWLACLEAGPIDVLATELASDEISGPALAARLKRTCPEMAAIYFGQQGTSECPGVLVRPFTSDDLLGSLATACASARAGIPTAAF